MLIKNSQSRYGIISILFHWIMAVIIIGLIIVGLIMTRIKDSPLQDTLFRLHKEFGILILMLVIPRILWRFYNIVPILYSWPYWEKFAARSVHELLYIIMFASPITGWLLNSAAAFPVSFFGLFYLPSLVGENKPMADFFANVHIYLAYLLIALIIIHVAAAIKHYFIDKDDILQRMLRF